MSKLIFETSALRTDLSKRTVEYVIHSVAINTVLYAATTHSVP